MNRLNQILVGVLVLQLVAAFFILWPRAATTETGAARLFPDLEAADVVNLAVTDANGETIGLDREGDGWVLAGSDGYPALADNIEPLLEKLVNLESGRLVTETPNSHSRLKVAGDDFERRITFELEDGTQHLVYLGTSPSYRVAHFRVNDGDEVYLTSELSPLDVGVQATAWVERTFFTVPKDEVVAFTLENANERFEFEKDASGTWTLLDLPAGESLQESKVEALVNRASSIPLVRPLGKEEQDSYGLQDPAAVVSLVTRGGETGEKTYRLTVGAQNEDASGYYVFTSESPYYALVGAFSVRELVENGRDDFLETPTPEPMPDATPTG